LSRSSLGISFLSWQGIESRARRTSLLCWRVGESLIEHVYALAHECAMVGLVCHLAPQIEHQIEMFRVEEGRRDMPLIRGCWNGRWREDLATLLRRAPILCLVCCSPRSILRAPSWCPVVMLRSSTPPSAPVPVLPGSCSETVSGARPSESMSFWAIWRHSSRISSSM
jgi:hypothetical protein